MTNESILYLTSLTGQNFSHYHLFADFDFSAASGSLVVDFFACEFQMASSRNQKFQDRSPTDRAPAALAALPVVLSQSPAVAYLELAKISLDALHPLRSQ
jgi:hypothetical protein